MHELVKKEKVQSPYMTSGMLIKPHTPTKMLAMHVVTRRPMRRHDGKPIATTSNTIISGKNIHPNLSLEI